MVESTVTTDTVLEMETERSLDDLLETVQMKCEADEARFSISCCDPRASR